MPVSIRFFLNKFIKIFVTTFMIKNVFYSYPYSLKDITLRD